MITKQRLITPLAVLGFTFSSEIALAAEGNDAGFLVTAWPLIVLSIVLVVFRKQLIIQATPEKPDSEHQESPKKEAVAQTPKKQASATKKQPAVAKAKAPKKSSRIDIKDDSSQCQAATAKGTRCKRTSSLENASVSINGKTYELTACKQHNNADLQVFSEFIK